MSNFLGDIFNKVAGTAGEQLVNGLVNNFINAGHPHTEGEQPVASSSVQPTSTSSSGLPAGIQILLDQAEKSGLTEKVRSWIGNGENLPISTEELRQLLSNDQVEAFLNKTGLPANIVLPAIAALLPKAVDAHTTAATDTNKAEG